MNVPPWAKAFIIYSIIFLMERELNFYAKILVHFRESPFFNYFGTCVVCMHVYRFALGGMACMHMETQRLMSDTLPSSLVALHLIRQEKMFHLNPELTKAAILTDSHAPGSSSLLLLPSAGITGGPACLLRTPTVVSTMACKPYTHWAISNLQSAPGF